MSRQNMWIVVAACGLIFAVAAGRMHTVAWADETAASSGSDTAMMRKLDRIMERLERITESMRPMPGDPVRPGRPGPGGRDGGRGPGGPSWSGPRRDVPPEQRERMEQWMKDGRKRMEEGYRRMEEAKRKFEAMERRIEQLEAEVAKLKRERE